jgi:NAD(P)H-flavin reductase
MAPVPFVVRSNRDELEDTYTLQLEPPGGSFEFLPGQFTMLYAFGIGEVPISISGDPALPGTLTQTIRGVGAVTRALRIARPGDTIGVRGPFGTAWPVDLAEGKDIVIAAGGIGLAPLRPAIYQVLAERDRFERVVILYGARNPSELLFADELQDWRGRLDADVLVTVDNAGRDWHGSVGVVTKLIRRAPFDPRNSVALVCGPQIMMRFTAQELVTRGVPHDAIHMSMERNMKCAIGFCGHCQYGAKFICRDGPVFEYPALQPYLLVKEV